MDINKLFQDFLVDQGVSTNFASLLDQLASFIIIIFIAAIVNLFGKGILTKAIKKLTLRTVYKWDDLLVEHDVIKFLVRILPAMTILVLLPVAFDETTALVSLFRKLCVIYICYCLLMAVNGTILAWYENHNMKVQTSERPMRGLIQVIQVLLFVIGAIVMISVVVNKSPATLLAGLGASAAIFSLVFKDLLTGFIAGVQLSLNDMVRPGDWVTLNDNKTDGIVQEITLITVKIKNFDNSIATVPPTLLLTNTFKNWREMLEADGRLVMKTLYVDKTSIKFCSSEMIAKYQAKIPLLANYTPNEGQQITNTQLFRYYMEQYLLSRNDVNQKLGLKIGELEVTDRGLPIQFFFFTHKKEGMDFERNQSDIMDHAIAMLPEFDLKIN